MTEGETRFYLREIHLHWSTSNVSSDKLAELQAARLIEFNDDSVPAVRLTSEGARRKADGRVRPVPGGISLIGRVKEPKTFRHRGPKKNIQRAKPLV